MARAQGDPQHIIGAAYFESQAQNWHGDYRAAIACLREALPTLEHMAADARSGMTGTASVMFHAQLAACHGSLGEFADALEHGRTAWRLAAGTKRDFDLAVASFGYGTTLLLQGTTGRAAEILEQGLAATEKVEIPLLFASLAGPLSYACLQNGNIERAVSLSQEVLDRPEVSAYSRSWALLYRAEVCIKTGIADAGALAHRALEKARENGYQAVEAMSHWMLCRVRSSTDLALARRHLATASAMASSLTLAPLEAHCFAEIRPPSCDHPAVRRRPRPRGGQAIPQPWYAVPPCARCCRKGGTRSCQPPP